MRLGVRSVRFVSDGLLTLALLTDSKMVNLATRTMYPLQ